MRLKGARRRARAAPALPKSLLEELRPAPGELEVEVHLALLPVDAQEPLRQHHAVLSPQRREVDVDRRERRLRIG